MANMMPLPNVIFAAPDWDEPDRFWIIHVLDGEHIERRKVPWRSR